MKLARGNMYYAQSPNPGWDPAEFDNPKYRGISARIIFYGATIGALQVLFLKMLAVAKRVGLAIRWAN